MLKEMNKRETEAFKRAVFSRWGSSLPDADYLKNRQNKVHLISKLPKIYGIKPERIGIYAGQITHDGVRLSIEGAQMLEPRKNCLDLDKKQMEKWVRGEDFDIDTNISGYVILRCDGHIIGCGKVSNGTLFNYVSKNRRIQKVIY